MITLQFVSENTWQDRMIRWATHSRKYSHVDFITREGLLGARPDGGVQIRRTGYARFSAVLRVSVEAPNGVLEVARSQIGQPYDWGAVFSVLMLNRDWRQPGHWFCSELVAWCFLAVGTPLLNTKWVPTNRISPRDLLLSPLLREELR
jgi:uncharacterized protein YycO